VADTVTLDHEGRHRRRVRLTGDHGTVFLLDLERATVFDEGDALVLDDGRLVRVIAARQPLLEVRAESPFVRLRLAWHLGNRHTPTELTEDALYLEPDPVLAEMLLGLGASVTPVNRPFRPERGAYDRGGAGGGHGHHHDHDHGHDHHHHG